METSNETLATPGARAGKLIPYFDAADDETTFSYRNRAARFTGICNHRKLADALFGSRFVRVNSPLHGGFDKFNEHLGRDPEKWKETIAANSHAPLFTAFMSNDASSQALELMVNGNGQGLPLAFRLRSHGVFRDSPAICLDCVLENIRDHRFAWHHRIHQVEALKMCPHHRKPLIFSCSACNSPLNFLETPSERCTNCEAQLEIPNLSLRSAEIERNVNLGRFFLSAYRGDFSGIDGRLRITTLQHRAAEIVPVRFGGVGNNLSRLIVRRYGRGFLQEIGLSPVDEPFIGWPTILIHGNGLIFDPVANLVLMSALFESPSDFLKEAKRLEAAGAPLVEVSQIPNAPRASLNMKIIRQLYRNPTSRVAANWKVTKGNLNFWTAMVPGFRERRAIFARRLQLSSAKKKLLQVAGKLEKNGNFLESLKVVAKETMDIAQAEPDWLSANFPDLKGSNWKDIASKLCRSGIVTTDAEAHMRLQLFLDNIVSQSPERPTSKTRESLLRMAGVSICKSIDSEKYPKTMALIDCSLESNADYYRRCLAWARDDLVKTFGRCDDLTELMVHAAIALPFVRPLKSYAESLLTTPTEA